MSIQPYTISQVDEFVNWQFALGKVGEAATDLDDIFQCIRIILTTPKLTVPHRPDFAVGYLDYLDRPRNEITNIVVADVTRALIRFEPRITVLSVSILPARADAIERMRIRIDFVVTSTSLQTFVEIPV